MNLLKREIAPLMPGAWEAIDNEARRVLKLNLAGRRLVDLRGPFGWEYAAVNIGRLDLLEHQLFPGVSVGLRRLQPLVEMRIPIELDIMELDSVARGADDLDLAPVVEASEKIARAEDVAIFNGYADAGIRGIIESSTHTPLIIPDDGEHYPHVIVAAKEQMREAGVDGPYALAAGTQLYNEISQGADDGYPIRKRIEQQIIDGPIIWAPVIEGGVLLSTRGGDFELTIGQDLSIGYAYHQKHSVELYVAESFTFRVLEPDAAIHLKHQKSGGTRKSAPSKQRKQRG